MENASISKNDIIIAWATPVNLALLGARLEAYVGTKAAITTFRLAAKYTTLSAFHNLPEEIMIMIASNVRDVVFDRKMRRWMKIIRCLSGECGLAAHTTPDELDLLRRLRRKVSEEERAGESDGHAAGRYSEQKFWVDENFRVEHQRCMRRYCQMLSNLDESSRFANCVEVFTRDFGVRPYFLLHKIFDYSRYRDFGDLSDVDIYHVQAQAFLTVPLPLGPIASKPSPHLTCFSIYDTINPSKIKRLYQAPLQKFKVAAKALNLYPYDRDWDETWSELDGHDYMFDQFSSHEVDDSEMSEDEDDDDDGGEYYDRDNYDDGDCNTGYSTTYKKPVLVNKETPGGEREAKRDLSNDDRLVANKDNAPNPTGNVRADDGDVWPQLMVLGCGQFRTWNRDCDD